MKIKLGFGSLLFFELVLLVAFIFLGIEARKESFYAVQALRESPSKENEIALAYQRGIDKGRAIERWKIFPPLIVLNSAALIWVSVVSIVRKFRQKENE